MTSIKMGDERLRQTALDCGATYSAFVRASDIPFSEEVRKMCEMNSCGGYGKSHTCPPALPTVDVLKEQVYSYDFALIIQNVYQLEDSFDYEGMMEAGSRHKKVYFTVVDKLRADYPGEVMLPLNAGSCAICDKCTYPQGEPCRFPDQAVTSIEAYGIFVNEMLLKAGLKYNNGVDTVSYVGIVLFRS